MAVSRAPSCIYFGSDIIVEQPRRAIKNEEPGDEVRKIRSEADLRGSLDNDSISEAERAQIDEERALAEETAKLREEDFQLSYAIDLLKGLSAIQPAQ